MRIPEPSLEPPEYENPVCPVCGADAEYVLRDKFGEIVGCDCCVEKIDIWQLAESEAN